MTPIWSYSSHNLWVGGTINTQDKFLKAFILQCITDFTGRSCMRMLYRVTFCTTQFMVSRFRASLTPLWTIYRWILIAPFATPDLVHQHSMAFLQAILEKLTSMKAKKLKLCECSGNYACIINMKIISIHEQVKSDKNNGSWILVIARNRTIRHWTIIQCLEKQDYKMSLCLCQEPRRNFFLLYTVSSDDKVYH